MEAGCFREKVGDVIFFVYIHSSKKSCSEQKNAWSRFALIPFKLREKLVS